MPRVSHFIRRKSASNIHHAIRIAEALGTPLNTFVTINFSMTECPIEEVSQAFAKLRNNRYAHWARRPGAKAGGTPCSPTHVWVIEAGGGVTAAHWLVHVPPARRAAFEIKLDKWLEGVVGPIPYSNTITIKNARTPKGAGRYMLKGMDETYATKYGINFEDQGQVHGRRCGYSQNIGPSMKRALREAGRYRKAQSWRPYSLYSETIQP